MVLSEIAEETFHRVQPGFAGGGEVETKAPAAFQPLFHSRMLLDRIVIGDQTKLLPAEVRGRALFNTSASPDAGAAPGTLAAQRRPARNLFGSPSYLHIRDIGDRVKSELTSQKGWIAIG